MSFKDLDVEIWMLTRSLASDGEPGYPGCLLLIGLSKAHAPQARYVLTVSVPLVFHSESNYVSK